MSRSPWGILGVQPDAPRAEVRAAYRRLARELHPDRQGGDDRAMQELNEAWRQVAGAHAPAAIPAPPPQSRPEPQSRREPQAWVPPPGPPPRRQVGCAVAIAAVVVLIGIVIAGLAIGSGGSGGGSGAHTPPTLPGATVAEICADLRSHSAAQLAEEYAARYPQYTAAEFSGEIAQAGAEGCPGEL